MAIEPTENSMRMLGSGTIVNSWNEHQVGAQGPEWQLSPAQCCLVAGRVVWFYAGKLIWPYPLVFVYPRWRVDVSAWRQYLFPVAAVAVVLALWFWRHRPGKGPLAAVLFFILMAAPVPAFLTLYFMRYSYVADHLQYFASMGLIALAAALVAAVPQRVARWAVVGLALASLGAVSWQRATVFRDEETVWQDTLAKNPHCSMAHNNLSVLLVREGKLQEAIWHCEQALRIRLSDAETDNDLAAGQYQQALPVGPEYATAQNNLGNMLLQAGRVQEAITQYQQALQSRSDFAEAHYNLANALEAAGNLRDAIGHYEMAVRFQPDYAEAHNNLGNALLRAGKIQEAINHYRQALQINPNYAEAHHNLGIALDQARNHGIATGQ